MSIVFKCKNCGAELEFENNLTVVKCKNCGATQALPKIDMNTRKANAYALLKRAFAFLANGDFANAESSCDRVLDTFPESAAAYLGKLMAEKRVRYRKDLAQCTEPFDDNDNYQKAVKYGSPTAISELEGYIAEIKNRIERARIEAQPRAEQAQIESAKKSKMKKICLAAVAVIVVICAIASPILYKRYQRYKAVKNYYTSILIKASASREVISQEIIRAIEAGADVNAKDDIYGITALMWAAMNGRSEVVKILLDAGADVNAKTEGGTTALMLAAFLDNTEVAKILLNAGANVNARTKDGRTALIEAASEGRVKIVKTLLDAGADVNAKDKDGKRAVDYARKSFSFQGTDVLKRLEQLSR